MTRLLEWLLGLDHIRLGRDAPLFLTWNAPIKAWMLLCLAALTLALVVWVYRREKVSPGKRAVLVAVRCGLIALAVAILAQPSLVLQRNRVEKAYVTLLVDASASMGVQERYRDADLAGKIERGAGLSKNDKLEAHSRWELVQAALTIDSDAALKAILQHNAIQLSSFAGSVEALAIARTPNALDAVRSAIRTVKSDGRRSDLAGALSTVLEKSQGRRIAAVVIATDGQATDTARLHDALSLAQGRRTPVFAVRIGSPARRCDVEVGAIRAQGHVFVHDLLALEAYISARGLAKDTTVKVRLLNDRTGTVLDTKEVVLKPDEPATTVELLTKPEQAGRVRYRVEAAPLPLERVVENNAQVIDVTGREDHLRVLYVEGYPRYEYRYLKNAIVREPSMDASVLLLGADERFVQEGTEPIRRFPQTAEELRQYDVILFGDVDPRGGWLSLSQMNMLVDYVSKQGGGFGIIAGERSAPQKFLGTPLEKLIPVRIDLQSSDRSKDHTDAGFAVKLTPEGLRSRIFRSMPPPEQDGAQPGSETAVFEHLSDLYWFARTAGPKPGATVLAEHPTAHVLTERTVGSGRMPLVVVGRYGAGRIFFQATDDTWRWRRHTGELRHDTYWVQVIRELMQPDRMKQDRRYVIRTDRRVYDYGSKVQIDVEILDTALLAGWGHSLSVVVERQSDGISSESGSESRERGVSSDIAARLKAFRLGPDATRFEAGFIPSRCGSYVIRLEGLAPNPADRSASASFRVDLPNLEARRPEADPAVLAHITEATGGRVVDLDELESAFSRIADRSVRIPDDVTEPLWDSRLVLVLFVLMISIEWGLRKVFGLL